MTIGEHADVVRGLAAGAVAATLSLLGISAQLLIICMIGGVFAVLFSRGERPWTVLAIYAASSCGGAVVAAAAGPLLAAWMVADTSPVARTAPTLISNVVGVLLPCVLYPLLRALRDTLPGAAAAWVRSKVPPGPPSGDGGAPQ